MSVAKQLLTLAAILISIGTSLATICLLGIGTSVWPAIIPFLCGLPFTVWFVVVLLTEAGGDDDDDDDHRPPRGGGGRPYGGGSQAAFNSAIGAATIGGIAGGMTF